MSNTYRKDSINAKKIKNIEEKIANLEKQKKVVVNNLNNLKKPQYWIITFPVLALFASVFFFPLLIITGPAFILSCAILNRDRKLYMQEQMDLEDEIIELDDEIDAEKSGLQLAKMEQNCKIIDDKQQIADEKVIDNAKYYNKDEVAYKTSDEMQL